MTENIEYTDMENMKSIKRKINELNGIKKNKVLSFFSKILILLSLLLSFLIYARKDENGAFLAKFNINVSFKTMNGNINKWFKSVFNFNLFNLAIKNDNVKQVSGNVIYLSLGDNLYQTDDHQIRTLHDGVIIYITKEVDTYTVLINYDNNVVASYFGLDKPLCKKYDQIEKGVVFSSYSSDSFKVLFNLNNSLISYEDAI